MRFESNQSGIETQDTNSLHLLCQPFESNQSGIETAELDGKAALSHSRLNRTRVELKQVAKASASHNTPEFESNQSGIETHHSARLALSACHV